jgi:hypothetical protein
VLKKSSKEGSTREEEGQSMVHWGSSISDQSVFREAAPMAGREVAMKKSFSQKPTVHAANQSLLQLWCEIFI